MATVDLSPNLIDVELPEGDSHYLSIQWNDSSGVAVDVSAGTWSAAVKATTRWPVAVAVTVDVTDAATGLLVLDWPAAVADVAVLGRGPTSRLWALYQTITARRQTIGAGHVRLDTAKAAGPTSSITEEWYL